MPLRSILLLLTCLHAGPFLLLGCATEEYLSLETLSLKRKKFLDCMFFADRMNRVSFWHRDQSDLRESMRIKVQDKFRKYRCLYTKHDLCSRDRICKKSLDLLRVLLVEPLIAMLTVEFKKIYPQVNEDQKKEFTANLEQDNFRLNIALYYHAFGLWREDYDLLDMEDQKVHRRMKNACYHLLLSLDAYCLTRYCSKKADFEYYVFKKLFIDPMIAEPAELKS